MRTEAPKKKGVSHCGYPLLVCFVKNEPSSVYKSNRRRKACRCSSPAVSRWIFRSTPTTLSVSIPLFSGCVRRFPACAVLPVRFRCTLLPLCFEVVGLLRACGSQRFGETLSGGEFGSGLLEFRCYLAFERLDAASSTVRKDGKSLFNDAQKSARIGAVSTSRFQGVLFRVTCCKEPINHGTPLHREKFYFAAHFEEVATRPDC